MPIKKYDGRFGFQMGVFACPERRKNKIIICPQVGIIYEIKKLITGVGSGVRSPERKRWIHG